MYNLFKELEGMNKEVEKNLEGLQSARKTFMDNHQMRMDILNRSLESIMIENEDRAQMDETMSQIDRDLDDLLHS